MLILLLPLLAVLLPGSNPANGVQEHTSFQVIQISFYANQSWAQNQGSGWLGKLQTHGWESESGTIIFLHTWSRGNFSNEELVDLELLFHFYFIGLTKEVQNYASQLQFRYPFTVQVRAGCELLSAESPRSFFQVAFEGSDFMSLQDTTWLPAPEGGDQAQKVCDLCNQYEGIKEMAKSLVKNTCPRFLLGLLDAGKMDLQRQVLPEAWLSSRPSPGSGRLLLVCHVSGFHPKPIWVMWMRGEQEQLGTKEGDILRHADGTWYRRVSLEVAPAEAAGLSCRGRHSSLGDQDIILHGGHGLSMSLIAVAVMAPLVLLAVLVLCCKKRW
ncbi:T-cell surface glycoprotein CD1c3 [Heterocephalus glaber]|uniref:T-cell surface glycoprotein CD1c3 n=1 Tax=Heterocephalus glaber TaxID=10181 RepID=A0AAX6RLW0_HETGA|nr:T-cell surface glycoprotein CD1c3 [Heterocephalus glaber]